MPILDTYITQTQQLLQLPQAPTSLYAEADVITWINRARGQLAGEAECIRAIGTIDTVVDQRPYNFSDIDTGDAATTGIDGVIHVRRINYGVGNGQRQIAPRPWEWMDQFGINNPVPVANAPQMWAQYGQGAAPGALGSGPGGSFYLDPPPDIVYTLYCDCVCWPIDLVSGEAEPPEAIPYLWTDAVPFYAAYYALMSAQNNARLADAERYYNMGTLFIEKARKASNPALLRWQYAQSVDPAQINKLSVRAPSGGQQ